MKKSYLLFLVLCFSFLELMPQNIIENNYKIGLIKIERSEVLEESDSTANLWFNKTLNKLHCLTEETTIRSRLLFKEGDLFNRQLIGENSRILRETGILGDAKIECDTIGENIINLNVMTQDKWTLGLNSSFNQEGGITKYHVALKEDNFLGNAQSLSFDLNYSSEWSRPYGFESIFKDPNLFNDWWKCILQFKNNDHLNIRTFLLERPMFSDAANWALGMYFDNGRSRIRRFKDGKLENQYDINQENQSLWYLFKVIPIRKSIIGLKYSRKRTTQKEGLASSYYNQDMFYVFFDILDRSYFTTKFVENFGRTEDYSIGYRLNMVVGKNFYNESPLYSDYYYQFGWGQNFHSIWGSYFSYIFNISSYLVDGKFSDAILNFVLLQHYRITEKNIFILRSQSLLGFNWSGSGQINPEYPTGLRGYAAYEFSGKNKLIINFEHRFFSDLNFWIFRFGSVLFFDTGIFWNENDYIRKQKFHSSVGIGVRIENTKQSGSGIVRIDFAYNFDRNKFAQIIISTDQVFSAFQNIQYSPANDDYLRY